MPGKRQKYILFISAGLFVTILLILFVYNRQDTNIKTTTFKKLEKIRKKKKQEIVEYFHDIRNQASAIKTDKKMRAFFDTLQGKKQIYDAHYEYEIDKYYVDMYGNFYDILFVDSSGFVFHSIKKESDYRKNLFKGNLSTTKLAEKIKQNPNEDFVEYEYYSPSNEPAAFYVVSLHNGNEHTGWFVLQCSINRVNTLLTDRKSLGRTGEIYLVNQNMMMLSDSRFIEDSTILKQTIDTQAVKEALKNNVGERIIEDYRNIRVFSSFEKFSVLGTDWIIITEIDEDEVITEFYKKNKRFLQKEIGKILGAKQRKEFREGNVLNAFERIEMNEFAKVTPDGRVKTSGVSTCTGIAILFPGKFGYLAHISPTDEIYLSSWFTKWILGDKKSDFMGEIIKRIKHYDVYPFELKQLRFAIIQTHVNSFDKAVDKILEHDIEIANITCFYNPNASSADILLDMGESTLTVQWHSKKHSTMESSSETENLGTIIKKIIRYETM